MGSIIVFALVAVALCVGGLWAEKYLARNGREPQDVQQERAHLYSEHEMSKMALLESDDYYSHDRRGWTHTTQNAYDELRRLTTVFWQSWAHTTHGIVDRDREIRVMDKVKLFQLADAVRAQREEFRNLVVQDRRVLAQTERDEWREAALRIGKTRSH